MCDYSLECYQTRQAQAGDHLTTVRFPTGSVGCVETKDVTSFSGRGSGAVLCATCLQPNTKLQVEFEPHSSVRAQLEALGVDLTQLATFVQLDVGLHHDAVRFENGTKDGVTATLETMGPFVTVKVAQAVAKVEEVKELPASITDQLVAKASKVRETVRRLVTPAE